MRMEIGLHPFNVSRSIVGHALRYGVPLVGGGIFIWIANNGLRFIVEHFEGAVAVGLITVGWALGLRAANFASMLVTAAAFPLAVKRARESGMAEGQLQLERNGVLLLIVLLPATVGLWLVAGPFVTLVVAEPFREMTKAVLPMALLAGTLRGFRVHFGEQVYLLREQPMIPLYNDLLDAVLSLLGCGLGLWWGGLPGSVTGVAVAAFVSMVVTLGYGWHWYRFALPLTDGLKAVGATAVMAFAVSRLTVDPTVFSIGFAALIGAIVYALAITALYPQGVRQILDVMRRRGAVRVEET